MASGGRGWRQGVGLTHSQPLSSDLTLDCLADRHHAVRAREVNREIERRGGHVVRQLGSHRRYRVDYTRPEGTEGRVDTTVAQHPGDISRGTPRAIERDLEPALGKGWLLR